MSNQIALIGTNANSSGGSDKVVILSDGSKGRILDFCQECYDPEKASPCGEDTTMTVTKTITEKTNAFDASLILYANYFNQPAANVIASETTTWAINNPHNGAQVSTNGINNYNGLLDLVPNPAIYSLGIKTVKVVKNGAYYRFNITFFNLANFNTFQDALLATAITSFFSIYKLNDVHLWKAAMYDYQGDDTTLSYWIDYDITQNPTNVNQKYWHLYTVLRLKDLTVLNNGFATQSNTPIRFASGGLPIEKVTVERVITFNNTCQPLTLTKTIELESVAINPKPNKSGFVNQFQGLLLTFKTT